MVLLRPCQPRPPSPLQPPPPPGSRLSGRPSPTSCSFSSSRCSPPGSSASSLRSVSAPKPLTSPTSRAPSAPPTSRSSSNASPSACSASATLEEKVRRSRGRPRHRPAARIHERPRIPAQSVRIAATRPHARGHFCPLAPHARADGQRTGPRHRPTPNPWFSPQNPTGPVHPLIPRGMAGPVVPIPLPGGEASRYLNARVDVG